MERYGVLTLLIPAILPPPAPFKIFVLLAGASRMSVGPFASAIAVGRGIRYFGIGLLTIWYGQRAITFLEENGRITALAICRRHRRARRRVLCSGSASGGRDPALTPASRADIMP